MRVHNLKIKPQYFKDVVAEVKKHKQYEFDLMLLNHKIEALIRGSER